MNEEKIFNMTQHQATPDQIRDGVIEPEPTLKKHIKTLLTFNEKPDKTEIEQRARALAKIAKESGYEKILIAGAAYLMPYLFAELKLNELTPVFSFTKRVAVEEHQNDGSVKLTYKFKHEGFIYL